MHRFWEKLIKPVIVAAAPKTIVEVGALTGLTTVKLLDYCQSVKGKCTTIDPAPQFDGEAFKAFYQDHFELMKLLSLEALPLIDFTDLILIDGDHNWYTVYHELKQVERIARIQGKFPLTIFHDTQWPYGRRDMYYMPDTIPVEHRKPHAKRGMEPGRPELLTSGGFNATIDNALFEHGEKNGVLTAIEDFIAETDFKLEFRQALSNNGLGLLYPQEDAYLQQIIPYLISSSSL